MDKRRLKTLIAKDEGQKTEFKASTSESKEAIQSLCAFAHSQGGTVIFGVRDSDKSIAGVQLGKKTLEDFANSVRQNTDAPLSITLEVVSIEGKDLIIASIDALPPERVCFAFGRAFIRVGRTTQRMSPAEIKDRHFVGFRAEAVATKTASKKARNESWEDCEKRRVGMYEENRGLFLVHDWRTAVDPEQVADIVVYLRQHPGADEPLIAGNIRSVEYHLGRKFSNRTIVSTDADSDYKLEISAYGPLLCLAQVNFEDGHEPVLLFRYLDF